MPTFQPCWSEQLLIWVLEVSRKNRLIQQNNLWEHVQLPAQRRVLWKPYPLATPAVWFLIGVAHWHITYEGLHTQLFWSQAPSVASFRWSSFARGVSLRCRAEDAQVDAKSVRVYIYIQLFTKKLSPIISVYKYIECIVAKGSTNKFTSKPDRVMLIKM